MLETPVAIVGMSCRLPGTSSVPQFLKHLINKKSGIIRLEGAQNAGMHIALGYLDNVDLFDHAYFKMGKREACLIDPQHRLFMTSAVEVLDQIGENPLIQDKVTERIGVFASCPMNTYLQESKSVVDTSLHTLEGLQATLQNDKDYLSLRTAHVLNLTGPAATFQSSCSSSAVATHYACLSLAMGDCDIAVTGGATLMNPQLRPYRFIDGSIFSKSGHCCPFTQQADGTVHGNGVAVLALMRLDDAIEKKLPIYSVIISSAINNNGNNPDGFVAPSVPGLRDVIERALDGIDIETIGIVETHGTGTRLGDKIEIDALTDIFSVKSNKTNYCCLSTSKSHTGHQEATSGAVSLIKASLSLNQQHIFSDLYPDSTPIELKDTPFYFPSSGKQWLVDKDVKRRVSINSSGMGGTNVHLVLEEAPDGYQASIENLELPDNHNKTRCWAKLAPVNEIDGLGVKLHSGENEIIYETIINICSFDWLKDHLLAGSAIIPGTYFVYLLNNMTKVIDKNIIWNIQDVEFKKALIITDEPVKIRIQAHRCHSGWEIQIESKSKDSWESTLHAVALATPYEKHSIDLPCLAELLRGQQIPLDVHQSYQNQKSGGLYHGECFQKLRHAVETPWGALGVVVDFEAQLKKQVDREVCLLDSCLQLFKFVHGENESSQNSGYLLTAFEKIYIGEVHWKKGQGIWCLAKRAEGSEANKYVTDFVLYSEDGDIIAMIQGAQEKGVRDRTIERPVNKTIPVRETNKFSIENVSDILNELIADAINLDSTKLSPTDSLGMLGMDSFSILELSLDIEQRLDTKIDFDDVELDFSIEEIAKRLTLKLNQAKE